MAGIAGVCNDDAHSLHTANSPGHIYLNRPIIELSKGIMCYIFRYYDWKRKFIQHSVVKATKYGHQLCDAFCKLDCR